MMKTLLSNYEEKNNKFPIPSNTSISELQDKGIISVRTANICASYNITIVSDLKKIGSTPLDFLHLRNCGRKTALELSNIVSRISKFDDSKIEISQNKNVEREDFQVFSEWLNNLFSDNLTYRDIFFKSISSVNKLVYALTNEINYLIENEYISEIQNASDRYFYKKSLVANLDCLKNLLEDSPHKTEDTNKVYNQISEFTDKFSNDSLSEYFLYETPAAKQSILSSKLDSLIEKAPTRVLTFHLSKFKSVAGLLPYLFLDMDIFMKMYGAKQKTPLDYYKQVIIPFKEFYETIMSDNVDNIMLHINYKFPFLNETDSTFVYKFYCVNNYFPMFYIIRAFLVNSDTRENDIFCRRMGFGKYKQTQNLEDIAAAHSLSRERVRQLLTINPLKQINLLQSEDWGQYFVFGNTYFTKESNYFTEISNKENLDFSFETFAYIYCFFFNYEYRISPYEYIVDKKYADVIQRIFDKLLGLKTEQISETKYYQLSDIFNKSILEDAYLCNLILNDFADLLDIQVENNKLVFEQNHIDIPKEIYEYLYSCGEPKHIEDIISYLSEKYPNKKFTITSVKFKLRDCKDILPVGKTSTYKLRLWRNIYSGNIRSLIRDVLKNSDVPLPLDIISDKVTDVFDTTKKNVHSSMSSGEDFIPYAGGLWGLKGIAYPKEYREVDLSRSRNTFEERFEQYKKFVNDFLRLPYLSGIEEEESLKRWQTNVLKRILDVSEGQIKLLEDFIKSKCDLPSSGREVNFYKTCKEYLNFVEQNFELPSKSSSLYYWFNKNFKIYNEFEDKRYIYFSNLLEELNSYGFIF